MSDRKSYRFNIGDRVQVSAAREGRDPGGIGEVTARESKEDNSGETLLYRVKIDGHPGQERLASEKGRRNLGFWYADELVNPAPYATTT